MKLTRKNLNELTIGDVFSVNKNSTLWLVYNGHQLEQRKSKGVFFVNGGYVDTDGEWHIGSEIVTKGKVWVCDNLHQ